MVNPSPPHHRDHKQFLLLLLLLLFPTGGKKEREKVAVAFWGGRFRSGRPQRLPLPPPPPPNIRDPFSKKISPLTHDTTTLPFKITDISPFFFQTPELSFRTRAPKKWGGEMKGFGREQWHPSSHPSSSPTPPLHSTPHPKSTQRSPTVVSQKRN